MVLGPKIERPESVTKISQSSTSLQESKVGLVVVLTIGVEYPMTTLTVSELGRTKLDQVVLWNNRLDATVNNNEIVCGIFNSSRIVNK